MDGFERVNATQVRYRPMSQVNPTGAVVPSAMAAGTWKALAGLRDRVGDIDDWMCMRLRWTREQLGRYLTSEQVDSVALAVDAADRGEGLIVADMTGFGKGRAQPVDNKVLSDAGWRLMGDIQVGDHVFSVDGLPTEVTGVFPQGEIEVFEIVFSDGGKTRCSADHLWSTITRSRRFEKKHNLDSIYGSYKVRTTSDLVGKLSQLHSIPLCEPVAFSERPVNVDPYLMGIILGYANKTAAHKFVPDDYLFNSPAVRLAVLQGLMDSDGDATPNGTSQFSSASQTLADNVAFLARSLGGVAKIAPPRKTNGLPSIRVTVRLPNGMSPFRLARKAERVPTWSKYPPCRIIRSIRPAGRAECRCISVAHPSRLYVTDDFIVTHNTLAATSRAAVLSGRDVVFLTEKANLFSDFWRDIRDIESEDVFGRPFMLNDKSRIVDTSSAEGEVIEPAWKKAEVDRVLKSGALPEGSRMMMATYSQFNKKGTRKVDFLGNVSRSGHMILDEAHNFVGGDSATGKTVGAAVEAARGSTFSSATFARDVTNLAAYSSVFPWLARIPGLEEMSATHKRALAEESVGLATAAGCIIRREHDLTNMVLRMSTAEGDRLARNEALADRLAPILSGMAKLARRVSAILEERNEANRQHLDTLLSSEERKAEREMWLTANFGSRLSSVLQQFLVALNVDPCVEMCVDALLDGQKPVVVIESTMESLMRELSREADVEAGDAAAPDGTEDEQGALDLDPSAEEGDDLVAPAATMRPGGRPPTFREALLLLGDRLLRVSVRRGAAFEKEQILLAGDGLEEQRDAILDLAADFPELSLSPIDDIRDRVEAEGRRLASEGVIRKPWAADEISARGMRVVDGRYTSMPAADRNQVVARFVNGATDMLVLTQAASTGLSIHDSGKFADHARRLMIELSPPRNVLARIQMWGRVWRRGQLTEPLFSVLDTGLPFNSYDLASRNRKLRELSASVTGTARATVSLDVADPIDSVGNEVAHELLQERQSLAETMGISLNVDKEEADKELYFVGKLFRRLPLLSTKVQARLCKAFFEAYEDRIRNGADVQSGRHLEGTWTPVRREILDAGDGTSDPLNGSDVTVTTLRSERDARPMAADTVRALIAEASARLPERAFYRPHVEAIRARAPEVLQAALPRKRYGSVKQAMATSDDNPVKRAASRLSAMEAILSHVGPGVAARLPGEDGELVDGVVVDVRTPSIERATVAREYEIHFVVPGDERPRVTSLDTVVREPRTSISGRDQARPLLDRCDVAPRGKVLVDRKVLDGGGIGAVLASRRMGSGTRVTYTDGSGRARGGILLPPSMERRVASVAGRTHLAAVAEHVLSLGAKIQTDPLRPGEGVEIRAGHCKGGYRVIVPGSKRAAKPFETAALLDVTGEFVGDWREREAHVSTARIGQVLAVLAAKGCDFYFEATHRGAAVEMTRRIASEAVASPPPRVTPAR